MPELPEVETILNSLKPVLEGRRLASVEVNRPDLRVPFPAGLAEILPGHAITGLRRRAKYMLLDFRHGWTLLIHLGMSGRLFVDPAGRNVPSRRHEHLVLRSEEGTRIALVDPRRFGMVMLFRTAEEADQPALSRLGVEPLSAGFTGESLRHACAGSRMSLKAALLDQRRIVGLGNIYVCEALFRAGLHPARAAGSLTGAEAEQLRDDIVAILREAIAGGGSTLRDYVHTDGAPGDYQNHHLVYGREGEDCPACQKAGRHGTIQRMTQSGRSTFFCPHCQKE